MLVRISCFGSSSVEAALGNMETFWLVIIWGGEIQALLGGWICSKALYEKIQTNSWTEYVCLLSPPCSELWEELESYSKCGEEFAKRDTGIALKAAITSNKYTHHHTNYSFASMLWIYFRYCKHCDWALHWCSAMSYHAVPCCMVFVQYRHGINVYF